MAGPLLPLGGSSNSSFCCAQRVERLPGLQRSHDIVKRLHWNGLVRGTIVCEDECKLMGMQLTREGAGLAC